MIWLIIYLLLTIPHYFLGKNMISITENNILGLYKDEAMKKGLQITCAICYPLVYVSLLCVLIIVAVMIPIKNCIYLVKKK